jgi:hypothetical protein
MVLDDAEIILAYNGELRGLANYYALAYSVKREMNRLEYIWQISLFKTLAAKYQISVKKIAKRLKTEDGHSLTIQGDKKTRVIKVFRLKDLKQPNPTDRTIDTPPDTLSLTLSRSELIRRLNTKKCEYCETTTGSFEVHHIRRMKDVAHGQPGTERHWFSVQNAMIFSTQENSLTKNTSEHKVEGKPYAVNVARTVWRGGDGRPRKRRPLPTQPRRAALVDRVHL